MSATRDEEGPVPPNFLLTPHQQALLFTALNTNKQPSASSPANNVSPTSFKASPMRSFGGAGLQESPYLDNYDLPYDFGDSSFDDFSFPSMNMIANAPATAKSDSPDNESNEKRGHPDDEQDDDSPGNDSKRHEGSDKGPKKPGRKPLTSEPTTVSVPHCRDLPASDTMKHRSARPRIELRSAPSGSARRST